MAIVNNNIRVLDRPIWEQLTFAPANSAAGSCMADDNERYIYYLISASSFWRYDTWADTWQQLANSPGGTVAAGTTLRYTKCIGAQRNGKHYGSLYLFTASGSAVTLYRYSISDNTWSAALSVAGLPATWGTDTGFAYPSPELNNWTGGYHAGVLQTVTTSGAAVNATSVPVTALAAALPAGTYLRFGVLSVTTTGASAVGANTIPVAALTSAINAGATLMYRGVEVRLLSSAAQGATSLSVYPLRVAIPAGAVITIEISATLTSAAAAAATSVTVSNLNVTIPASSVAYYYDHMYLIGHATTVMYRYSISANAWYTTSANSGNPAIPAVSAAVGAGCALRWLPGASGYTDKLIILRGANTIYTYTYDLVANTMAALTTYPATEAFTTGTSTAGRSVGGRQERLVIQKDNSMRFYELDLNLGNMTPIATQNVIPNGGALAGDRMSVIASPDGIEFLYFMLHTSNVFMRTGLFF